MANLCEGRSQCVYCGQVPFISFQLGLERLIEVKDDINISVVHLTSLKTGSSTA